MYTFHFCIIIILHWLIITHSFLSHQARHCCNSFCFLLTLIFPCLDRWFGSCKPHNCSAPAPRVHRLSAAATTPLAERICLWKMIWLTWCERDFTGVRMLDDKGGSFLFGFCLPDREQMEKSCFCQLISSNKDENVMLYVLLCCGC